MTAVDPSEATPLITLVVPSYNVARYLPEFFASMDAQTVDPALVEVVFVDDGATDESAELLRAWSERTPFTAQVISVENGGLARARNIGLARARGVWVSFPDPDDRLSPNYLQVFAEHMRSSTSAEDALLVGNLLLLDDATGVVTDNHPLRAKFATGQRVLDLERFPQYVHLQAASAFYRRAVIESLGLIFDHRIKPNFEDGSFTTLYLADGPSRRMMVFPQAEYLYRQRSDGTSLVQSSWRRREKYTDLLEFGHLALLRSLAGSHGAVPLWAQNVVLYDLAFFFRNDVRPNSPLAGLPAETLDRFHELLPQILDHIDDSTIEAFSTTWLSEDMRQAMLIGAKGRRGRPTGIVIDKVDVPRRIVRGNYYFSGPLPDESYRVRGFHLEPNYSKIRDIRFLGRIMVRQRIVWLPANGTLAVDLGGYRTELLIGRNHSRRFTASPWVFWKALLESDPPDDLWVDRPRSRARPTTVRGRLGKLRRDTRKRVQQARTFVAETDEARRRRWVVQSAARLPFLRLRFRDAWLLIDRDDQAQDNAERLYEWIVANRPETNAWFVLNRDSVDWERLRKAGFRLIAHQSLLHRVALLRAQHVVSSQIDHYIVAPLGWSYGERRWLYTFLQHGVTKDDLSGWINPKPISLMITATPDEQASIVDDGTPYIFTDREVRLTGFPRHDRLLALGEAVPASDRKLILVTPTWRRYLLAESIGRGNARQLRTDFWHTDYAAQWRSVIESPVLHEAAREHGYQILFVPHPNMQDYLDDSPLPDWIEVRRFREIDIQDTLAHAGVLVTDYSSMAFESAYLTRATVYFQFDKAEFFSGSHAYRQGTWDYERDGFGPVTETRDDAVRAVVEAIGTGGVPLEPYASRVAAAFPFRDGRCSERTFEAIAAMTRPLPYEQAYRKIDPSQG